MNEKRFRLRTAVALSFATIIALVLATSITSQAGSLKLQEETALVERGLRVRLITMEIEKLLVDAETGQRGYLYTNDKAYLSPYNSAMNLLPERLEALP